MATRRKLVLITCITLVPFFAYPEGQDWMMPVDNAAYFFKLFIIYFIASLLVYAGIKRISGRKIRRSLFLLLALSVMIVHWELTKQKPLNGPVEKYLNSKDIDTARLQ